MEFLWDKADGGWCIHKPQLKSLLKIIGSKKYAHPPSCLVFLLHLYMNWVEAKPVLNLVKKLNDGKNCKSLKPRFMLKCWRWDFKV